ncbi:MAG: metallopeptidase [Mycobacterium sp.]
MSALAHGFRFGAVLAVGAGAVGAVLALAGCGSSAAPQTQIQTTTSAGSAGSQSAPDAPPDPHTLLRAGALALAQVPDSALIFIESQTDDAGTWKVQVVTSDGTEQELKIGSDGVAVLVGPTPTNDNGADKAKRLAIVQAPHPDYRAAVDKTLAAVPSGSITELNLRDVNGAVAWHAQVWDTYLVQHRVIVDGASGEVTSNQQV